MDSPKHELKHIGVKRRSGRYPWGSGDDPYQRNKSFVGHIHDLEKQGLSEVEIAKGMGMSTSELREKKAIAKAEIRAQDVAMVMKLKEKGYSNVAIGERMGINESSVRSLQNVELAERAKVAALTATILKEAVDKKKFIDVGVGVEVNLGVSSTKLKTAIAMLEEEGYVVHPVYVPQVGTGKTTIMKVLCPPGTSKLDAFKNRDNIKLVEDYSEDGGRSFFGLEPIKSVNSNRIHIRGAEDGGKDKDGVIELRRGVEDISLGNNKYGQVRIGVNGTHYMKGMAMYSDDIPNGFDIVYNTNKSKTMAKEDIFKKMSDDPDNPIGASLRQKHYIDSNGKQQLSAINFVGGKEGAGEEGSWGTWSKTLSSQVLSKQRPELAKQQLKMAFDLKKEEFDEINSLTNPAVKKRLLETFADEADAAAVHLKAAAMPRQASQVLLPIVSMKENEIYAPNFHHGEPVVLIRHPHGGTFEIPELTVNNKAPEARRLMGNAKDAVGINPKVAARLSGADFDGDTVLVIPNKSGAIKTSPALKSLKDFDPKDAYKPYDGMKTIDGGIYNAKTNKVDYGGKPPKKQNLQAEMGKASNLITDMTIRGANEDEIARAVKHSMVVIDSEKHKLNYRQSYIDNGISDLKAKYQGGEKKGASTLISRASAEYRIPERKEGKFVTDPQTGKTKRIYIDPKTGKRVYEETGRTYIDSKGKLVVATTKTKKLAEKDDAFELSSGMPIETIYAKHSNALKELANTARKALLNTPSIKYSASARETYSKEVEVLKSKLRLALQKKPYERQAQLLANKVISMKKKSNPDMEKEDLKKVKGQALEEARNRVGSKKKLIEINDREWEAIQAGAISDHTLSQILMNTDLKLLKQRAMPRYTTSMSPARIQRAQFMFDIGHTRADIAEALGVSISTLEEVLSKGE